MKITDKTLLEQLRITEFEIDNRKKLFAFSSEDIQALLAVKDVVARNIDATVDRFYDLQTSVTEIALLIGDADTLQRLRNAQCKYVADLFNGSYDIEYVNNRLRIGLVHKRIGVEPKLYLAAISSLKSLLIELLHQTVTDDDKRSKALAALEKLIMFDIALVFETYIGSLVSEIELSKAKTEQYAHALEDKVKERTEQLEQLSRTDPLTGLLNVRHLSETLTQVLQGAQRRSEAVTMIYIDIDDFKSINDTQGHQRGDDVLQTVAQAIRNVSRAVDHAFRYGGDEFCILLANCAETKARQLYGDRLLQQIHNTEQDLGLSIGYAQSGPSDHLSPTRLIQQADDNMYAAKRAAKQQPNNADNS